MPLDLAAFGALLAIFLLVSGTIVLSVALALGARLIDRLWDAVSPGSNDGDGRSRRAGQTTRLRNGHAGASRTVVGLILLAALLSALAWLSFLRDDAIGPAGLG